MSDLTINNKKGDLSKILRQGAIIGMVITGAIITTPPYKNNDSKKVLTTPKHVDDHTSINKSLSSSFDDVGILGMTTVGIAFGLYRLGRRLDNEQ